MTFRQFASVLALVIGTLGAVIAQTPQAAPLNWDADDGKRVAELTANGERREGKRAILITPAGVIDDKQENALLDRLDRGHAELRAIVGRHPWQVMRAEKITYYVSPDRFVAHASGRGAVFIPLVRLQDDRAPYLHEAAHELLAYFSQPLKSDPARAERVRTSRPLWLTEGLADYVALTAADRAGVTEGDVFDLGGLAGVDKTCDERLKGPRGAEIVAFIGNIGAPGALFTTERTEVAPTFYACGTSFTKFVVERIGLPETIALVPLILTEGVLPRIEKLTGKSTETLRAEWRLAIAGR
jgi:hypothetical protein